MAKWKPITDFEMIFDLSGFNSLHDFAFLAMQSCNLKNASGWYGHFRAGEAGMRSRLFGVTKHYGELHAWKPEKRDAKELEYHLASILFGMDSAIECCVYMLNALGWATLPDGFADISNDSSLKRIVPANILNVTENHPMTGYTSVFPDVQSLWLEHRWLIEFITEQHDASKHRQATGDSGTFRSDPPPNFFEQLGIADSKPDQDEYLPPMEVLLYAGIKKPNSILAAGIGVKTYRLEDMAAPFEKFISKLGRLAEQNARKHIKLSCKPLKMPMPKRMTPHSQVAEIDSASIKIK